MEVVAYELVGGRADGSAAGAVESARCELLHWRVEVVYCYCVGPSAGPLSVVSYPGELAYGGVDAYRSVAGVEADVPYSVPGDGAPSLPVASEDEASCMSLRIGEAPR